MMFIRVRTIFYLLCCVLPSAGIAASQSDVVLITIDTLRADRVGCYGYTKAETPAMDRLAKEGILFKNAISHVPLTRPSHTSMFTGLYPFEHNVHDNVAPSLDPKIPVLAELLRNNGYATGAFVASFVVNSQSGLQRGFDLFADKFDAQKQPGQFALNLEKTGSEIYDEFADWQSGVKSKPYFAWIHLYDPHFPYEPPDPYANRFSGRPYDGEVAYSDSIVGKILKLLRPNTLLIVTSDHGESLGDHGENAHSFFIYDSTLHVPLLIRWPGKLPAAKQIEFQTRLVDLFPTILDLLNIPAPKKISGTSLKPWLSTNATPEPDLYSYCETFTPWLHFGWSRLLGIRSSKWKYIEAPRPELYDLQRDPSEARNLYSKDATPVRDLRKRLHDSGALKPAQSTGSMQDLDPETLEKLASLGYAGVPTTQQAPAGKIEDPKEKIADFRLFNQLIREGIEAFQAERYSIAAEKFETLRKRNIPSFEVHYYLGRSYLRLKSYDKARTELELALRKLPHFLTAYKDLSEAWEAQGKVQEAEKALLAGLTVSPNSPLLVQPLAWFYQKQKNYPAAEKILLQELKEHPDDLESRFRLGAIYRNTGRTDAAMQQFLEIVARDPQDSEAHNQLGMLYGATNRLNDSIKEFQKAAGLAPGNEAYLRNLELAKSKMSATGLLRFQMIQTKTKAVADVIYKKLQKGEKWEVLAQNYSIHPSARSQQPVLELSPSEIDPAIAKTLSVLKAGQFSAPIQTPGGFFLLLRVS
ncbi:tetratricopeptide repeat protein [bacterium]|nr:tetratricopeptide repeat protein [bacterium]MCI0602483.1 tetratricopeptide repeat protein [bacterium]